MYIDVSHIEMVSELKKHNLSLKESEMLATFYEWYEKNYIEDIDELLTFKDIADNFYATDDKDELISILDDNKFIQYDGDEIDFEFSLEKAIANGLVVYNNDDFWVLDKQLM